MTGNRVDIVQFGRASPRLVVPYDAQGFGSPFRGTSKSSAGGDNACHQVNTPPAASRTIPGCNLERPFSRMEWRQVRRRVW